MSFRFNWSLLSNQALIAQVISQVNLAITKATTPPSLAEAQATSDIEQRSVKVTELSFGTLPPHIRLLHIGSDDDATVADSVKRFVSSAVATALTQTKTSETPSSSAADMITDILSDVSDVTLRTDWYVEYDGDGYIALSLDAQGNPLAVDNLVTLMMNRFALSIGPSDIPCTVPMTIEVTKLRVESIITVEMSTSQSSQSITLTVTLHNDPLYELEIASNLDGCAGAFALRREVFTKAKEAIRSIVGKPLQLTIPYSTITSHLS